MAAAAGALLGAPGCASSDELDAQEKAKRITKLVKDSEEIVTEVRTEFTEANLRGTKPDADRYLKMLAQSEKNALEAVRLSRDSSKPAKALIWTLHFIAHCYVWKREDAGDEILALEAKGEKPSKKLRETYAENDRLVREYFLRTVKEIEYYLQTLHARFPEPTFFVLLVEIHELQGQYEEAIAVCKRAIRVDKPKGEVLAKWNERIQKLEDLMLDATEKKRASPKVPSP